MAVEPGEISSKSSTLTGAHPVPGNVGRREHCLFSQQTPLPSTIMVNWGVLLMKGRAFNAIFTSSRSCFKMVEGIGQGNTSRGAERSLLSCGHT